MTLEAHLQSPEPARFVTLEVYESHDGERCDCIASPIMVLAPGDSLALSEHCSGGGSFPPRQFSLTVKVVSIQP